MSYEDEEQGNEFANGANGRFDGMAAKFTAGGSPRKLSLEKGAEVKQAMTVIGNFYRSVGMNPELVDENGFYKGPVPTLELLREFKQAKDLKEAADVLAKEAGALYDYLRLAAVPERFDQEGIANVKVDGVGRVQLAGDLYAGIIKGQEEQAFTFLDDNGRGDVVKKTVNSSSLKAILKGMITKGEEIPAELFKAEPFTRASIVKA